MHLSIKYFQNWNTLNICTSLLSWESIFPPEFDNTVQHPRLLFVHQAELCMVGRQSCPTAQRAFNQVDNGQGRKPAMKGANKKPHRSLLSAFSNLGTYLRIKWPHLGSFGDLIPHWDVSPSIFICYPFLLPFLTQWILTFSISQSLA